jgi:hypothetical protein
MPSVTAKHPNGEGALRAIQALMCELGADPPGYFDPFPRQPLQWANRRSRFAAHAALSGVGALPHNELRRGTQERAG